MQYWAISDTIVTFQLNSGMSAYPKAKIWSYKQDQAEVVVVCIQTYWFKY